MLSRKKGVLLGLLLAGVMSASSAHALNLASLKIAAGYIPDGKVFGGLLKANIGPFSTYAEFFRDAGVTTAHLGGNPISFKLPTPKIQPYFELGGGLSHATGHGDSKTSLMGNAVVGAEMDLGAMTRLFAQSKYIYTFRSDLSLARVRTVAIQAGLSWSLDI